MINHLCIFTILLFVTSPVVEASRFKRQSSKSQKKYEAGKTLDFNGTKVEEYLGIPFAKPPLNESRFMPPQEIEEPENVVKAEYPAATCPQYLFETNITALDFWNPPTNNISENCLQLNMWVPENKTGAVLVNLCGGAYWRLGASNDIFNGSVLAAYSGAIVVNLNFRLGALGFARLNGTNVTGNMGMLDQQMGLQWIKKNIQQFGGDPSKVTLMGEQTGASSAEAHLYAKNSSGLFRRIALTSGTLENTWGSRTNHYTEKTTEELAKKVNCTEKDPYEKLKCLQNKNITEIINATKSIRTNTNLTFGFPFSLTRKDGNFFAKDFTRMKAKKKEIKVLICAVNWTVTPPTENCTLSKQNFKDIVTNIKTLYNKTEDWEIKVLENYTTNGSNYEEPANQLLSDLLFDCGLKQFADKRADDKSNNTYVYMFNHTSLEKETRWPDSFGTVHATLIEFLFGRPFRYPGNYSDNLQAQKNMSEKVMKLYGEFAKNGKPSKDWSSYTSENKKVITLDLEYGGETVKTYNMSKFDGCDELIKPYEKEITQNVRNIRNKRSASRS
uniref:COesterase domain-containing protein n=1 Tax=Parastrongyloides trichosuri TaxID=131310 RepID=A0A0N4ZDW7_PARTI